MSSGADSHAVSNFEIGVGFLGFQEDFLSELGQYLFLLYEGPCLLYAKALKFSDKLVELSFHGRFCKNKVSTE
jgi:hypothetical protein